MGSSPYGAFQPVMDLAEEAKDKFNDVTSGGPVRRLFQKKPDAPAPSSPKPTAKQLGWADPPKPDDDQKPAQSSAGQRAMRKPAPTSSK